jgi:uroporphyrinogen-III synthase
LNHTVVATIGPVTSDAAVRYGITPQVTPATSTMTALVEALAEAFQRSAR